MRLTMVANVPVMLPELFADLIAWKIRGDRTRAITTAIRTLINRFAWLPPSPIPIFVFPLLAFGGLADLSVPGPASFWGLGSISRISKISRNSTDQERPERRGLPAPEYGPRLINKLYPWIRCDLVEIGPKGRINVYF